MALRFNVKIDTRQLDKLRDGGTKAIAFGVADGLNNTAKLIQRVQQDQVDDILTVRKPKVINRSIAKIKPFASPKQGRAFVDIFIDDKRNLLLSTLEKGGRKRGRKGGTIAVPITSGPARPTFKQSIPSTLNIRKLKFKNTKTKSGKKQRKGLHRTFVMKPMRNNPKGGVFQRVGPGRGDIRLLYSFVAGGARLSSKLRWMRTTRRVTNEHMTRNIEHQLNLELQRRGL